MSCARRLAPGVLALAALLWLTNVFAALASGEGAALLEQAEIAKSSQPAKFEALLERLQRESDALSDPERYHLRYLLAWRHAYQGDYDTSVEQLHELREEAIDPVLRLRATATAANVLAIARQYQDAFVELNSLLAQLPEISDARAREQALAVVAFLYNQVGEYELGLKYAGILIEEGGSGACRGGRIRIEALYKSRRFDEMARQVSSTLERCARPEEKLNASIVHAYAAKLHLERGQYEEAIKLLNAHYAEARSLRYPHLMADFEATLARGYLEADRLESAHRHAIHALESGARNPYIEPIVSAYRTLYLLSKERGDMQAALSYHEKYAAADKGYLDDVSARQLAYQRVSHDFVSKKLQIDALNKQNEVLQLQQALGRKAAETSRLYIILLVTVLAFIALWAYRTKRSQLHFMKLSRIDGLTGIANRPHFMEQAERALEAMRRSAQPVCVVLCDLDHFKSINDEFGHATGDFVLKQTVAACKAHLGANDLFGRFGGEEFGILLPGCELEEARRRCEQLRQEIEAIAVQPGSLVPSVSASFGVAASATSGYELRQLLAHADAALYRAKHAGRNCVVVYEPGNGDDTRRTAAINARLRGVGG
ncbi:MAG TPA: GGDEF domain-containing protein [Steroidobacteraceae bacterium]